MSNRNRVINTPELSTVKSLNDANTDQVYFAVQQITDDSVAKVSVSDLISFISSSYPTGSGGSGSCNCPTSSIPYTVERRLTPAGEGTNTETAIGMSAVSQFAGAATRITLPTSSIWLERQIRNGVQAATTVNSVAGKATQPRMFSIARPTIFSCVVGITGSAIADMRITVGLVDSLNSLWSSTTQPSTFSWAGVFVGLDSTDTNLQLMHKATSVTATKINLGSDFARAQALSFRVDMTSSAGRVDYTVTRLDASGYASGFVTTNMPEDGAKLCWYWFCSNTTGGTIAAVDSINFTAHTQLT